MVYLYNGENISGLQFTTLDGTNYPAQWTLLNSVVNLQAIGVVCLEEIWPPLGANQIYDGTYVDTDTQRIYNVVSE
jgi:hypothetical protein